MVYDLNFSTIISYKNNNDDQKTVIIKLNKYLSIYFLITLIVCLEPSIMVSTTKYIPEFNSRN
ncbi:MAG: hypothetical protein K0R77_610 [Chryseobacterium sp.]|nr:hypothetical protein [Chryseobacterium sp.]